MDAKSEFMKTPLGKISQFKNIISRGANKVQSIFSKSNSENKEKEIENHQRKTNVTTTSTLADRQRRILEERRRKVQEEQLADFKNEIEERRRERENRTQSMKVVKDFQNKMSDLKVIAEERANVRAPELRNQIHEMRTNPESNPLPELPFKKSPTTLDEDEAIINENYDPFNPKTSQNCIFCTMAYDLRRRGYDVRAREKVSYESASDLQRLYEGSEIVSMLSLYKEETGEYRFPNGGLPREQAISQLNSYLLKQPEGARGSLGLNWEKRFWP